jgi:hypothetical protein
VNDFSYFASENINFYTCANADKVYSNLKLDNTAIIVAGNASDASPKATCDFTTLGGNLLKIDNNGSLISFLGNFTIGYNGMDAQSLVVNGASCSFDNNHGLNKLIVTRSDGNAGGFVEGWFSIHYRDPSNNYHTLKGNFRAKRIG